MTWGTVVRLAAGLAVRLAFRLASRLAVGLVVWSALWLSAGSAAAALRPFEGTLAFELPGRAPLAVTGVGLALVESAPPLPALRELRIDGGISGTAVLPITDPVVTQAGPQALRAEVSLGAATLGPLHPLVTSTRTQLTRATLPIPGWLRLCVFEPDCGSGSVSLPLAHGTGLVGLGMGGVLTAGGSGDLRVSALAAPWTLKTVSLPLRTPGGESITVQASGAVHGPASFTGSTTLSGGTLSLVTPLRVTSAEGTPFASFSRLTLRFLPEPAVGAAVACGAALLGAGGLARRIASARSGPRHDAREVRS